MYIRIILTAVLTGWVMCFCQSPVFAQGGWRQWDIYLLDGSRVEANPLGMTKNGRFTLSMGKESGLERSKISYIAAGRRTLPSAPSGDYKQDLVIMVDGSRSLGTVTFRKLEFSEGMIVQNDKEISLENVAYVKFAQSKRKGNEKRRGPRKAARDKN
jgi:hypothetical protein